MRTRPKVKGWPVTIVFHTRKAALQYAVAMGCLLAGRPQPSGPMRISAIAGLQLGKKIGGAK